MARQCAHVSNEHHLGGRVSSLAYTVSQSTLELNNEEKITQMKTVLKTVVVISFCPFSVSRIFLPV